MKSIWKIRIKKLKLNKNSRYLYNLDIAFV